MQTTTEDQEPDGAVLRLSTVGRAGRALLLGSLSALFLTGTVVGDDTWWPFGPWRMFATSTPPQGAVTTLRIEERSAGDPRWRPAVLSVRSVGLTRAEVEGRLPRIVREPAMLGTLARTHSRLRPDEPEWEGVRVARDEAVLRDGAPTGEVRTTIVASWP